MAKRLSIAFAWLTLAVGLKSFSHCGFLVNLQEIAPQYSGVPIPQEYRAPVGDYASLLLSKIGIEVRSHLPDFSIHRWKRVNEEVMKPMFQRLTMLAKRWQQSVDGAQAPAPTELVDRRFGFGIVRDVGNRTHGKESATSRLNDHINFSSGPASCSRFMPQITENGNESIEATSQMNGHFGNSNSSNRFFVPALKMSLGMILGLLA